MRASQKSRQQVVTHEYAGGEEDGLRKRMRRKRGNLMKMQLFGVAFLKLEQRVPSSPEDGSPFPGLDNTGLRQERRVDTWRGNHRAWTSTFEELAQCKA